MRRALAALTLVALTVSASSTLGAPPGPATTRTIELVVTASACEHAPDGVCLAYNGQVPAPLLDVNLGDRLVVTLRNEIGATIGAATTDAALAARLAAASVSWHVHGTALSAAHDGIAAHAGTQLIESVAPPGGSFTYHTRAAFAGSWHYHDHVLGPDGSEGVARGLYGGLVVRNGAEPRAEGRVFDLHLLDHGPNGGRGLSATVRAGEAFEVLVVTLGDRLWDVQLRGTTNAVLDRITTGPGMSDRFRVEAAAPGAYTLRTAMGEVGRVEVVP